MTQTTRVGVVGAGYVGLIQAVGLAMLGFDVRCLDLDAGKVARLRRGVPPIVEPGLPELLREQIDAGRLTFTTDPAALADAGVVFVAVGTPTDPLTGSAQLDYLWSAATTIAGVARAGTVLAVKSTVPIGTCERLQHQLDGAFGGRGIEVVSNPEFLREGCAIGDFLHPERIVIGGRDAAATDRVRACYATFEHAGVPVIASDWYSSETIKYASNAFLATKLTFVNEIANLTEAVGGDIETIARGMGLAKRIGSEFLRVGLT